MRHWIDFGGGRGEQEFEKKEIRGIKDKKYYTQILFKTNHIVLKLSKYMETANYKS